MAHLKIVLFIVLIAQFAGCATISSISDAGFPPAPYAGTRQDADVAWDILVKHEKYSDETPALIGVQSLLDLPFAAVGDTLLLPATLRQDSTVAQRVDQR